MVGYRDALARAGIEAELGEGICVGVNFHLADNREQAAREATPFYEEHAKMFAPLGFFRGLSDEQHAAVAGRGGWDDVGFPNIDRQMKSRSWFCGTGDEMVSYLKELEAQFPGTRGGERAVQHGHTRGGDGRAARTLRGRGDAGVPRRGARRAALRGVKGRGAAAARRQRDGERLGVDQNSAASRPIDGSAGTAFKRTNEGESDDDDGTGQQRPRVRPAAAAGALLQP